ncbi:MAG: CAAD domain-containing protein [Elainellaceae cyanobacterium]
MEPDVKQNTPGLAPDPTGADSDIKLDAEVGGVEGSLRVDGPSEYDPADAAYPSDADVAVSEETANAKEQWQKIGEQASTFLSELPSYISDFFFQYKRPIITIGLILGTVLGVKVSLAVLDAINDVPLLASTFELIGIVYFIRFCYNYFQSDDFVTLKAQVLGRKDKPLDNLASKDIDS